MRTPTYGESWCARDYRKPPSLPFSNWLPPTHCAMSDEHTSKPKNPKSSKEMSPQCHNYNNRSTAAKTFPHHLTSVVKYQQQFSCLRVINQEISALVQVKSPIKSNPFLHTCFSLFESFLVFLAGVCVEAGSPLLLPFSYSGHGWVRSKHTQCQQSSMQTYQKQKRWFERLIQLVKQYCENSLTCSAVIPFSKALYKLSFVIAPTIRLGSWYSILCKKMQQVIILFISHNVSKLNQINMYHTRWQRSQIP